MKGDHPFFFFFFPGANSTPPLTRQLRSSDRKVLAILCLMRLSDWTSLLFARLSMDIHPGLVLNLFTTANQKINTCETPVDEMSHFTIQTQLRSYSSEYERIEVDKKMSIRLNSWIYAISKDVESYYMTSYRH